MKYLTLIMHAVAAVVAVYIGIPYLQSGQIVPVLLTFSLAVMNVVALIIRARLLNKE